MKADTSIKAFDAYAFAIARSVATRALRRRREREAPLPEALVAPAPRGGGSEEVRHALAKLPPEQREVVVLKFLEGMTAREIAEITGARQSTVESRLAYALDKLRRALAGWMRDTGDPLLKGPIASPFYYRSISDLQA